MQSGDCVPQTSNSIMFHFSKIVEATFEPWVNEQRGTCIKDLKLKFLNRFSKEIAIIQLQQWSRLYHCYYESTNPTDMKFIESFKSFDISSVHEGAALDHLLRTISYFANRICITVYGKDEENHILEKCFQCLRILFSKIDPELKGLNQLKELNPQFASTTSSVEPPAHGAVQSALIFAIDDKELEIKQMRKVQEETLQQVAEAMNRIVVLEAALETAKTAKIIKNIVANVNRSSSSSDASSSKEAPPKPISYDKPDASKGLPRWAQRKGYDPATGLRKHSFGNSSATFQPRAASSSAVSNLGYPEKTEDVVIEHETKEVFASITPIAQPVQQCALKLMELFAKVNLPQLRPWDLPYYRIKDGAESFCLMSTLESQQCPRHHPDTFDASSSSTGGIAPFSALNTICSEFELGRAQLLRYLEILLNDHIIHGPTRFNSFNNAYSKFTQSMNNLVRSLKADGCTMNSLLSDELLLLKPSLEDFY